LFSAFDAAKDIRPTPRQQPSAMPALPMFATEVCAKVRAMARCDSVYRVPYQDLQRLGLEARLKKELTVTPTPKIYRGKNGNPPFPIYAIKNDVFIMPREFGLRVFGVPDTVNIPDGDTHACEPILGLRGQDYAGCNQIEAVDKIIATMMEQYNDHGTGGAILALPPGAGKTACAAHIFCRLGGAMLFVTPSVGLMDQVADDFRKFLGPDFPIGKYHTKEKRNWKLIDTALIVVAVGDSVSMRQPAFFRRFRVVCYDEMHEYVTAKRCRMFFTVPAPFKLGLSATPHRPNKSHEWLDHLIGPIAVLERRALSTMSWGKADVVVVRIHHKVPIVEAAYKDGDFNCHETLDRMLAREGRHSHMLADVARCVAQGRRILCLGKRVAYMERFQADLMARHGIDAGLIVGTRTDGTTPTDAERRKAREKRVLIMTSQIGYRALNIPELDTIEVLDYATTTELFWRQCGGRITRDCATKQMPMIRIPADTMVATGGGGTSHFAQYARAASNRLVKIDENYHVRYEDVEV